MNSAEFIGAVTGSTGGGIKNNDLFRSCRCVNCVDVLRGRTKFMSGTAPLPLHSYSNHLRLSW